MSAAATATARRVNRTRGRNLGARARRMKWAFMRLKKSDRRRPSSSRRDRCNGRTNRQHGPLRESVRGFLPWRGAKKRPRHGRAGWRPIRRPCRREKDNPVGRGPSQGLRCRATKRKIHRDIERVARSGGTRVPGQTVKDIFAATSRAAGNGLLFTGIPVREKGRSRRTRKTPSETKIAPSGRQQAEKNPVKTVRRSRVRSQYPEKQGHGKNQSGAWAHAGLTAIFTTAAIGPPEGASGKNGPGSRRTFWCGSTEKQQVEGNPSTAVPGPWPGLGSGGKPINGMCAQERQRTARRRAPKQKWAPKVGRKWLRSY